MSQAHGRARHSGHTLAPSRAWIRASRVARGSIERKAGDAVRRSAGISEFLLSDRSKALSPFNAPQ